MSHSPRTGVIVINTFISYIRRPELGPSLLSEYESHPHMKHLEFIVKVMQFDKYNVLIIIQLTYM